MEAKQTKKIGIIILSIICILCIIVCTYFISNKYFTKENINTDEKNNQTQTNTTETSSESSTPAKNDDYTFYKELKETAELNEKEIELIAYYYIDSSQLIENDTTTKEYYILRRETYANGTLINFDIINASTSEDEIKENVPTSIFESIETLNDTTSTEQYLIVELASQNDIYDENHISTYTNNYYKYKYIINYSGATLKTIQSQAPYYSIVGIIVNEDEVGDKYYQKGSEIYSDENEDYIYIYPSNNYIDLHEDFIYYIVGDCENIDEYKLYIESGIVKEEKIASYNEEQISSAGGC